MECELIVMAPGRPADILCRRPLRAGPPLGAHMSIAGGVDTAPLRGREVGCDAIQVFTKSNRQWRSRPLGDEEVEAFRRNVKAAGIGSVVAHDCYLLNLAAPAAAVWKRSVAAFRDELERAERLGIPYLVTHPGSHLAAGETEGIARVAEALNVVHAALPRHRVRVLLETTAGQGSSLGYRFEQLAAILEQVEAPQRVGICLDTCHLFAGGYDIRSPQGYRETMRALAMCVGVARVKAIHLNDSRQGLGSRVDRHAHIGEGRLGLTAFGLLLNDPRFRRVPMILETPKDEDFVAADRRNLARLRR
ncbi:MAG: deoxyribonuclease IV, partial [candidate division NC10 bacterium RBG_16_65_8]